MIKIPPLEQEKIKLMPYNMNEDNYIISLHNQANAVVFDDVERNSISNFKNRIKQSIETDTLGWACWLKEPTVKLGIVYFSHVIPGISALFHFILDINAYKDYIKSNGNVKFRIMDESARLVISYLFSALQLQRITGQYFTYNRLAINFCKKLGFKEEGIIRQGTKVSGQPVDIMILGLLRNELI